MVNKIYIWQPRYHDDVCLIGKKHVREGMYDICFTKAKHLNGKTYRMSASEIKTFPLDTNGKITCYAVPMPILLAHEFREKTEENTIYGVHSD